MISLDTAKSSRTLFPGYFRGNLIQRINIPQNLVPTKIISLKVVIIRLAK